MKNNRPSLKVRDTNGIQKESNIGMENNDSNSKDSYIRKIKQNKSKILVLIVCVFVGLAVGVKLLSNGNNRVITILDSSGEEYYSIKYELKYDENSVSCMFVKDNGAVDSVISQVVENMKERLGYSTERALEVLNKSDLTIYSTIDIEIQDMVDDKFADKRTFTDRDISLFPQGAMVIMDYEGNIKAVGTGNSNDTIKNRATETLFKVGSTIKPVSIYAPAVEEDLINFTTLIEDIPSTTYYDGKSMEWPSNYDNRYEGLVTITEALQKSKNTVAVRVGKMLGEEKSFNFLKDSVGYSTIIDSKDQNNDKQLSALALGYFSQGVPLDILTASYEIFGNGGLYYKPSIFTKVVDSKNNVILENYSEGKRVISEETSTIMNRLLFNNVNEEIGIAKEANIDEVEVIGKTGTVADDAYTISKLFVGGTPEYIAGVWLGYDDESPILAGEYKAATLIWKDIMEDIKRKKDKFNLSDKVITLEYCTLSGGKATDYCTERKTGYYKNLNELNECNICK